MRWSLVRNEQRQETERHNTSPKDPKQQNKANADVNFEWDSRQMTKMARDYHEPLQAQDIIIPDNSPEWEPKVASVLSEILAGQCLNEQDLAKEEWTLTYEQVKKALHNGMATGIDA